MRKSLLLAGVTLLLVGAGAIAYVQLKPDPPLEEKFSVETRPKQSQSVKGEETAAQVKQPPSFYEIAQEKHTYQTFNNCGPATLSMVMSFYGVDASQKELGDKMRPYQNPQGDNDDKTIFTSEFVGWAKNYGLNALRRPNGDIELLKLLIANDIPVVVKTWLNVNEDIGHFRIVRGYDDERKVFIQDDSYHGPNKKISYFDFLSMWQPFNYDYMIVYDDSKREIVEQILGSEFNENVAWQNALVRARKEEEISPENVYAIFNQASASYRLGDYQTAVSAYERAEGSLPGRMLWYQIEPIQAYKELGNYGRVFQITDNILTNGNRAYSELYQIRGEIYLSQGKAQAAMSEFEQALLYNKNYKAAQEALNSLLND